MGESLFDRARRIFLDARELPPERRQAYLDSACEADDVLRREVEAQLAYDKPEPPVQKGHARSQANKKRLDEFLLVREIGKGGMGRVFEARQEGAAARTVAIKLLRDECRTDAMARRFEGEVRALARMDHPNIARIFEARTVDRKEPYLVMEYVPGTPITDFCDSHKLPIRQRLELFVQVCDAISHAHIRQFVHRDIKPHNALSYIADGKPSVKVIDFGIAKQLEVAEGEHTMHTLIGTMVGTYEYMSPEQADGAADIDTRTDVYSLGVLLYELLTGVRPFNSGGLSQSEIRRIIREVNPATPSARLLSGDPEAINAAQARGTDADSLAQELCKELEWIPLKAMRKDRERRYESAAQLAQDVRNYLDGLPLIAAPESKVYRFRKFVGRRRLPLTAAALVLATLVAGIIGTSIGFVGQRRLRVQADLLRSRADQRAIEAEQARAAEARAKEEALKQRDEADQARAAADQARTQAQAEAEAAKRAEDARIAEQAAKDQAVRERDAAAGASVTDRTAKDKALVDRQAAQEESYVASIASANSALAAGNISAARAWLDTSPIEQRNWEWRYLDSSYAHHVLRGNTGAITSAMYSPDGSLIATASSTDQTVRLWSAATYRQLRTLRGKSVLGFSDDGTRLLTENGDKVTVWDTGRGAVVLEKPAGVRSVLLPDGRRVMTGLQPVPTPGIPNASRPFAQVWDINSGTVENTLAARDFENTNGAGFSQSGQFAFTVRNKLLIFWNLAVVNPIGSIERGPTDHAAALSPSGRYVATGSLSGGVRVVEIATGKELFEAGRSSGSLHQVLFSPDGTRLLTAAKSGVQAWDAINGKPLYELTGAGEYSKPTFSADGSSILTINREICVWDAATGTMRASFQPAVGGINSAVLDPTAEHILIINSRDRNAAIWDIHDGGNGSALVGNKFAVYSAAFCSNGARVVTASADGTARIFDARTRQQVAALPSGGGGLICAEETADGSHAVTVNLRQNQAVLWILDSSGGGRATALAHGGAVTHAAFTPDCNRILSCAADRTAALWDARTGKQDARFSGHSGPVNWVEASANNEQIVTASDDGSARIWNTSTGQEVLQVWPNGTSAGTARRGTVGRSSRGSSLPAAILCASFSPDSARFATADAEGHVRVWDSQSGTLLLSLDGHRGAVKSVAYSPDGTRIVTAGIDHTVRLWDTVRGRELLSLRGHSDEVYTARFSPDGSQIVTASKDKTARIWGASAAKANEPQTQPTSQPDPGQMERSKPSVNQ